MAEPLVATYSIAACDLEAGQWGVATQSKFLAVGSIVPWAEPGVGAVATQAYANPRYGPDGLALLREGLAAGDVVERLTAADDGREQHQQPEMFVRRRGELAGNMLVERQVGDQPDQPHQRPGDGRADDADGDGHDRQHQHAPVAAEIRQVVSNDGFRPRNGGPMVAQWIVLSYL